MFESLAALEVHALCSAVLLAEMTDLGPGVVAREDEGTWAGDGEKGKAAGDTEGLCGPGAWGDGAVYEASRDRKRQREGGGEALEGGGCSTVNLVLLPRGPPKTQGRYRRVSGKGAGPGQQLAKVRTPAVGALTLVGILLSL